MNKILFAGWNYGLEAGRLTPQTLAPFGIKTLALTESCAHVPPGTTAVSIGETYQDLRNLGEIFNIRARATKVISGMQAQVAAARAKVSGLKPVTVFDYDSGQSAPFTGPGLAMPTALISLGGGINIFGGLKQSWRSVSLGAGRQGRPAVHHHHHHHHHQRLRHPDRGAEGEVSGGSPITRKLTAVRNRCFLPLAYDEVTPGPRNAQAAVAIAR
jgi:iron complex transport system substrate-binding protein